MGVLVGLDNLHYAIISKDDETGVEYGEVKSVGKSVSASIQPKSNSATLYADDGPAETATSLGEIQVDLEVASLPTSVVADLLGATVGSDGVLIQKSTDNAPYVAIGFRSKKSNGKYRYVWLLKGKFAPLQEDYKTQEDSPSFQTEKISGTFIRRDYDNAWQVRGDEDDPTFTGGPTWFNAVYQPPTGSGS
ncbi:major tail protein [Alicyclobacillus shizuokensis]|uniref:major tail protein n=1 Tax=Alicyclobacillus shizuokensis TaxID=392014 RepID=UPI0008319D13|nr:major tail protein [Alicyclobacillus shizuokensis]